VDETRVVMEVGERNVLVPLADNPAKIAFFEKYLTQ
jgi:hypothetical protein